MRNSERVEDLVGGELVIWDGSALKSPDNQINKSSTLVTFSTKCVQMTRFYVEKGSFFPQPLAPRINIPLNCSGFHNQFTLNTFCTAAF